MLQCQFPFLSLCSLPLAWLRMLMFSRSLYHLCTADMFHVGLLHDGPMMDPLVLFLIRFSSWMVSYPHCIVPCCDTLAGDDPFCCTGGTQHSHTDTVLACGRSLHSGNRHLLPSSCSLHSGNRHLLPSSCSLHSGNRHLLPSSCSLHSGNRHLLPSSCSLHSGNRHLLPSSCSLHSGNRHLLPSSCCLLNCRHLVCHLVWLHSWQPILQNLSVPCCLYLPVPLMWQARLPWRRWVLSQPAADAVSPHFWCIPPVDHVAVRSVSRQSHTYCSVVLTVHCISAPSPPQLGISS